MEIEKGKNIDYNHENYIILSIITQNNTKYIFVNKIDKESEEPTDEYCILKENKEIVMDESLINQLLPKFQEDMKKDIERILN